MDIVDRIRLLTVVAGAMFLTGLVFVADAKNFIVERDRGVREWPVAAVSVNASFHCPDRRCVRSRRRSIGIHRRS
jgi:hypothetical protein